MIAFLEGTIAAKRENSLVIQINGLGFEVFAPKKLIDFAVVNTITRLNTYLLVREDALTLFGFIDQEDLELFKLLISVSGIGSKSALSLLSNFSANSLASAIANSDIALLSSAPGIGKKTAERMCLELQNKLPADLLAERQGKQSENPAFRDAIDALVMLGYKETQVRSVIAGLIEVDSQSNTESLIRQALKKLK